MKEWTPEEVQANRVKGVAHLRTTTRKQGFGLLYSERKQCYCALGELGFVVGIDGASKTARTPWPGGRDLYDEITAAYNMDDDTEADVLTRNDVACQPFRAIGNELASIWGIA